MFHTRIVGMPSATGRTVFPHALIMPRLRAVAAVKQPYLIWQIFQVGYCADLWKQDVEAGSKWLSITSGCPESGSMLPLTACSGPDSAASRLSFGTRPTMNTDHAIALIISPVARSK